MSSITINGRRLDIADDIRFAIDVMKEHYGAVEGHASGHLGENRPSVIYEFRYGKAQVALRMNKRDATAYFRDQAPNGRRLSEFLKPDRIDHLFAPGKKVLTSLNDRDAPYLAPSAKHRLIRIKLRREDLRQILDFYLTEPTVPVEDVQTGGEITSPTRSAARKPVTAEELLVQLDRNSQTGNAGEVFAIQHEIRRLNSCGCIEPDKYVSRVALTDVGCGYDIKSSWMGEERCIEVKSTTLRGSDLFITENERLVLTELGSRAWIYRVHVKPEGCELMWSRQNPIAEFASTDFAAVVWRVRDTVETKSKWAVIEDM